MMVLADNQLLIQRRETSPIIAHSHQEPMPAIAWLNGSEQCGCVTYEAPLDPHHTRGGFIHARKGVTLREVSAFTG